MEKTKNKKAFSLVELVVVITILTILAGIGSMSFFSYLKDGNDAKRITDIQSIKIQLDNYRRNHGYLYPVGEGGSGTTTIMSGSEIIAHQSYFNNYLAGLIELPKVPLDPSTNAPYIYSLKRDRTSYQLTATLESENTLLASTPHISKKAYANDDLTAYVEGSFIPKNKNILPGLLYATSQDNIAFDIANPTNLAKVILNGQSLNLAYDMDGIVVANGETLSGVLAAVSLVENGNLSNDYQSCVGVIDTSKMYYHGENEVEFMNGIALNSQIGWKYKTCDGKVGTMKPVSGFYYNCSNLGAGAIFTQTCEWTGCGTGYTPRTDGVPGCKANANAPVLASPVNGAYSLPQNGVLSWYKVSGATEYKLYFGNNGNFSLLATQNTNSYNYTGLSYSTTYNWYVEACQNGVCTPSITYTFSTLANPSGGSSSGGGATTPEDPAVENCESGNVICTADDVIITYVGTNGTPLDGAKENFGESPRNGNNFYGNEKTLQYKIENKSDGRAKFKIKMALGSDTPEFINAANASFDNSNINTVFDIGGEGIANNLFWKAGNGCAYNASTGGYDIVGKTSCFITFHARSDSSVPTVSSVIGNFQIVNIDTLSTWPASSYTSPTSLRMKASGFDAFALTLQTTGSGQQALEPSNDMEIHDFGTSTRIGTTGYGYWKSITYRVNNPNPTSSYFKMGFSGRNTSYLDLIGMEQNYDFPLQIMLPSTIDPNTANSWTGSQYVIDLGGDGIPNIMWKNNSCAQSPSGTDIGKGFVVPASGNCSITMYFRSSIATSSLSRPLFSFTLLNQPISGKTYTYDATLKGKSAGLSVTYTNYVVSETLGWMKLALEHSGAKISGVAQSENTGWICFSESCGANITRNISTGQLTGYAMSEMLGWIKMDDVILADNGTTSGYAQSEVFGWINFNY